MPLKIQIHYSDSDITIRPVLQCKELGLLERDLNYKTKMWHYKLTDMDQISEILKESGLRGDQIELIETDSNFLPDTKIYQLKSKCVGWELLENRIFLTYTYNLKINDLIRTFNSKKFDPKLKRWSVDTSDWLPLREQLEDLGYILQSLLYFPQLGITEEYEGHPTYIPKVSSSDTNDIGPIKKQPKSVKCFSWKPKKAKHEYDDTPMSTQAWKEHVIKDFI